MFRNATFRQLLAFHTVARLGSVSKAASELNLTQPAVSIQIGLLEAAGGAALLERQGRGIRLTEAGDLMAGYAARILDLWREAADEMATHQGVFSGTLRIGAVTTAEYLLPPLLVKFTGLHPNVKVKLAVGNREEIVRLLGSHEVDLVIMGRPPREMRTESKVFAKHPMAFIAGAGHPLTSRRDLSLADMVGANLLVRERGSGTRTTLERILKDAHLPLRIGSELSSNEAIKQMCVAGFGVAFLSLHACGLELDAGILRQIPLRGFPIQREWFVIHLAARQVPQVSAAFMAFLMDEGSDLIRVQLQRKIDRSARRH